MDAPLLAGLVRRAFDNRKSKWYSNELLKVAKNLMIKYADTVHKPVFIELYYEMESDFNVLYE